MVIMRIWWSSGWISLEQLPSTQLTDRALLLLGVRATMISESIITKKRVGPNHLGIIKNRGSFRKATPLQKKQQKQENLGQLTEIWMGGPKLL